MAPDVRIQGGAHFVVLDFINVDDAGGSLFPMIEQVRRAVGWVYRPGKVEPASPGRWTVLERVDDKVVGGNTYFVRVRQAR